MTQPTRGLGEVEKRPKAASLRAFCIIEISVSENIGIPYQYGLGESGFAACFDGLRQPRGEMFRAVEAFVQGGEADGGFRVVLKQFF